QAIVRAGGWEPLSIVQSIREGYNKSVVYLLMALGFILLVAAVVLPLLFAISLAFTNYDLYNSPPKNLLDWVGFDNFVNLVTVPIWNNTFINVFSCHIV